MAHNKHTESLENKDLNSKYPNKEAYLKITENFKSLLPKPVISDITLEDGREVKILRDDLLSSGSKARFGEYFVSTAKSDTIVYVAPRVGLAGISLMHLAKLYGKKCIFFAPASKQSSSHQRRLIEEGATVFFCRIAAMPVLNKYAREYAEKNGYVFAPLGLDHPYVIAGAVRACQDISDSLNGWEPSSFFTATSTAVLNRGLQIGWPNSKSWAVCVARNLKKGERGRANIISHPLPFTKAVKDHEKPPFPSVDTYDSKAWLPFVEHAENNSLFWNVGKGSAAEAVNLKPEQVNSYREWGDLSDFK